jgi:hypothetical protein
MACIELLYATPAYPALRTRLPHEDAAARNEAQRCPFAPLDVPRAEGARSGATKAVPVVADAKPMAYRVLDIELTNQAGSSSRTRRGLP